MTQLEGFAPLKHFAQNVALMRGAQRAEGKRQLKGRMLTFIRKHGLLEVDETWRTLANVLFDVYPKRLN